MSARRMPSGRRRRRRRRRRKKKKKRNESTQRGHAHNVLSGEPRD